MVRYGNMIPMWTNWRWIRPEMDLEQAYLVSQTISHHDYTYAMLASIFAFIQMPENGLTRHENDYREGERQFLYQGEVISLLLIYEQYYATQPRAQQSIMFTTAAERNREYFRYLHIINFARFVKREWDDIQWKTWSNETSQVRHLHEFELLHHTNLLWKIQQWERHLRTVIQTMQPINFVEDEWGEGNYNHIDLNDDILDNDDNNECNDDNFPIVSINP